MSSTFPAAVPHKAHTKTGIKSGKAFTYETFPIITIPDGIDYCHTVFLPCEHGMYPIIFQSTSPEPDDRGGKPRRHRGSEYGGIVFILRRQTVPNDGLRFPVRIHPLQRYRHSVLRRRLERLLPGKCRLCGKSQYTGHGSHETEYAGANSGLPHDRQSGGIHLQPFRGTPQSKKEVPD